MQGPLTILRIGNIWYLATGWGDKARDYKMFPDSDIGMLLTEIRNFVLTSTPGPERVDNNGN